MTQDFKTAGQVANEVGGISRQTIYFYEEMGLITPVIKTEAIRLYTPDTIDKVKRIRELGKDHKLAYIKELLDNEGKNG